MTISAVIFDLNCVLVQSEYLSSRLEKDYGVMQDLVIAAINEVMPKLREPNAPSVWSLFEPYIINWELPFTEEEFLHYWFSGEGLNSELFDYVKELKCSGVKVFILSNNFKERFEYYQKQIKPLLDIVDKAYFSFQKGIIKPDVQAWQQIIDEFVLEASNCLYVDDSNTNVGVAKSLGMIAVKYSGIGDLKKIIC